MAKLFFVSESGSRYDPILIVSVMNMNAPTCPFRQALALAATCNKSEMHESNYSSKKTRRLLEGG